MINKAAFKTMAPFILRFIILHVLTYAVFGIFFMLISGYFEYFDTDPLFSIVMKPSDSLSVRLAIPAQIFRGALLAGAIYPFRDGFIERPFGWLRLFFLLFILTAVGSVITGPGSIEGLLYTRFSFNPLIGYPEIGIQMAVFSWLFCYWQKKEQIKSQRMEEI